MRCRIHHTGFFLMHSLLFVGFPVISGVFPPYGPLSGGTVVTMTVLWSRDYFSPVGIYIGNRYVETFFRYHSLSRARYSDANVKYSEIIMLLFLFDSNSDMNEIQFKTPPGDEILNYALVVVFNWIHINTDSNWNNSSISNVSDNSIMLWNLTCDIELYNFTYRPDPVVFNVYPTEHIYTFVYLCYLSIYIFLCISMSS